MYKSRLELYKKLIYFLRNRFSFGIAYAYRTYFAHIFYSDIMNASMNINNSVLRKQNNLLLDIGGARGEFCKVLSETYDLNCINLDPNRKGIIFSPTVIAVGQNSPFKDKTFDVVLCRGLLEHVPLEMRERILAEIRRVLKNDGISQIVVPPWCSPHAGHQIKPFHMLPVRLAAYLARHIMRFNVKAKSLKDLELYPVTFHHMSNLLKKHSLEIIKCHDVLLRNHFLTRIPIMREFMIPSIAFNVRKINNHPRMHGPRLIVFFGPDGSGKTTQARLLASHFQQQGFKVRLVWIRANHSLASILSKILANFGYYRIIFSQGKSYRLFDVKFLPRLKGFWGFIEFISVLPWILIKVKFPLLLGYVVITHRYVVDTIVSVAYILGSHRLVPKYAAKILLSMVSGAFLVHLDAEKETITERRKEEKLDLDFIRFQRRFYLSFATILGVLSISTSSKNTMDTFKTILDGYYEHKQIVA